MMKELGVFLWTGRAAVYGIVTLTGMKVVFRKNDARTQHTHNLQGTNGFYPPESPKHILRAKYAMQSFKKLLIIQDK